MATSPYDDEYKPGKKLSAAEQAEFDQLARQLHDTPAGDSDQPYDKHGYQPSDSEETEADRNIDLDSEDIRGREQSDTSAEEDDRLGRGYTPSEEDWSNGGGDGKSSGARQFFQRKRLIFGVGGIMAALISFYLGMMSLAPWQMHNIFENFDKRLFARLQGINMNGRSQKWLKAYMTARILDIEEGPNSKKMSDNLLFRAERVDTVPWYLGFIDWYKTVRTSAFEADMFEKHGIKFASAAVRQGNQTVFRPAKITIDDKVALEFDLRSEGVDEDTLQEILRGDIAAIESLQRITGRIDDRIQIELFDNRTARAEVRREVNRMFEANGLHWWNAMKRYHLRKNIQNMTGIVGGRYFETTRENLERIREKGISVRNKFARMALPTSTRGGQFIGCMFGYYTCVTRPDPSAPENRSLPQGAPIEGGRTDAEGNSVGTGEADFRAGLDFEGPATDVANKIALKILKNGNIISSVIQIMNSLATFHHNVTTGVFSGIIETARTKQVLAIYFMGKIAADQLQTGEAVDEEVSETVDSLYSNATNTESWSTLVNERPNIIHAAVEEFVPAANKKEYCSAEYQQKITNPEYIQQAKNGFVYNCSSDQPGARNMGDEIAEGWMNAIGGVMDPVFTVWYNSAQKVAEFLFDDIIGAITGPIMEAILNSLGFVKELIVEQIEKFMGWVMDEFLKFSGAGIMWDQETTLSGRIINLTAMGGAVGAEAGTRFLGGALTTPQMEQAMLMAYRQNEKERYANMSFHDKYLSFDNYDSLASRVLFNFIDKSPGTYGRNLMASLGNILSAPLSVLSTTVNAADPDYGNPYTGARKLANIDTYDYPKAECIDREVFGQQPPLLEPGVWGQNGDGLGDMMTPQNATNADDPGIEIFEPNELTWDLMQDSERWYNELYSRAGDDDAKIMSVWNCALLENAVAGAMGGIYGHKGVGAAGATQYKKEE